MGSPGGPGAQARGHRVVQRPFRRLLGWCRFDTGVAGAFRAAARHPGCGRSRAAAGRGHRGRGQRRDDHRALLRNRDTGRQGLRGLLRGGVGGVPAPDGADRAVGGVSAEPTTGALQPCAWNSRPAAHRSTSAALRRRTGGDSPHSPGAQAAARGVAAGRVRFDGTLCSGAHRFRARLGGERRPGRGVRVGDPAHPNHPRAVATGPGPGSAPSGGRRRGLVRWHPPRRGPGPFQRRVGLSRHGARRHDGDPLRRLGSRRAHRDGGPDAAPQSCRPPRGLGQSPESVARVCAAGPGHGSRPAVCGRFRRRSLPRLSDATGRARAG